ncbi:hypothetical protein SDC9_134783 [bioreactor metagenome]|uniref:Uncharacterized protein n=1 Tax=bioreactor metagenome TaxID=1076179 RepID=A0A645DFT6_9ZZZZ
MRAVELARHGGVQRVVDQRALARAGHARHAGKQPHGKLHRHVLQTVAAGTDHTQRLQLALRGAVRLHALGPATARRCFRKTRLRR